MEVGNHYCKPSVQTFNSYSSARNDGVANLIVGNGWLAENEDGLLTAHVCENSHNSGNVAEGLTATLYVLDFEHDLLWETNNKCNQIFNTTPKDDASGQTICETDNNGNSWAAPRNYLYVVSDGVNGTFNVTERIKPLSIPQKFVDMVMCAAFNGTTSVEGSEACLSSQNEAVMQIPAPSQATIVHYQIRVGIDSNNDGKLAYDESVPLQVYKYNGEPRYATICGTTSKQCDEYDAYIGGKVSGLQGAGVGLALPVGRSFLSIFYNGDASDVNDLWMPSYRQASEINAFANYSGFSEWLTHNSGANFSESGSANIWEYVWQPETAMAQFMAQRTPLVPWQEYTVRVSDWNSLPGDPSVIIGDAGAYREQTCHMVTTTGNKLLRFFNERVLPQAINVLSERGDGATETFSSSSGLWSDGELAGIVFENMSSSPAPGITQVIGATGNYGGALAVLEAGSLSLVTGGHHLDDLDAFFSVGRGRILEPTYSFTVRKTTHLFRAPTYDLIQIGFSCRIQDLYDFNFEDGKLSRSAAALQIGFGNGNNSRSHGRIFRHEIRINTTYQNPFAN